jgi:hypothetical protein
MPEQKPQDLKTHPRFDPLFHFFMMPVTLVTVLVASYQLTQHHELADAWFFILAVALMVGFLKIRLYALKVQDRVIRLEERLRMEKLLPENLKARIPELEVSQIVALRFASDAELPSLVEKTLAGNLKSKEIKQSIVNWRADHYRV